MDYAFFKFEICIEDTEWENTVANTAVRERIFESNVFRWLKSVAEVL